MTTTSEEVWQLLRELIESQKETEKLLKDQSFQRLGELRRI